MLTNVILIGYTILTGDREAAILAILLMPLILISYLNWRNNEN